MVPRTTDQYPCEQNPWTKKNPFMSMWLSAANTAAAPARGRIKAEATRQTSAAMAAGELNLDVLGEQLEARSAELKAELGIG